MNEKQLWLACVPFFIICCCSQIIKNDICCCSQKAYCEFITSRLKEKQFALKSETARSSAGVLQENYVYAKYIMAC